MNFTIKSLLMDFPGQGKRMLFVAIDDNFNIVGSVSIVINDWGDQDKSAKFDCLFVHANFRKAQIGQKLIESCKEYANSNACNEIRATVLADNKGAIAFYKRLGFETPKIKRHCYELVIRLKLKEIQKKPNPTLLNVKEFLGIEHYV